MPALVHISRTARSRVLLAAVCTLAALVSPSLANAAPPGNDDFANAVTVSALPFHDSIDLSEATSENGDSFCGSQQTVWYSFTPASTVVVRASPAGSNFVQTDINVFRAVSPGLNGLSWVTCGTFGSDAVFTANAGTTYYIQGGSFFGGGTLSLTLTAVPSPPNDDFASAVAFSSVPFNDSLDITGATTQAGEPVDSCNGQFVKSIWYAFTPSTTGNYIASAGATIPGDANVYTGSGLGNLTRVACGARSFHANAGSTYYIQAGTWFQSGQLSVQVDVTPPPAVGFFWGPGDPSVFDNVQFFDQSFDPGGIGIDTRQWDFGDGATATGQQVTHRFAKDGDYTVKLTDTTTDGRTNSATNVIQVRTHDVGIAKLAVPLNGRAGKTVQIVVSLSNSRYPESVQLLLYRSSSGGFDQVAALTETVPVMKNHGTLAAKFAYTFTTADAALGKVTFKASAQLQGLRDALPGDNDAIAPPTKVSP